MQECYVKYIQDLCPSGHICPYILIIEDDEFSNSNLRIYYSNSYSSNRTLSLWNKSFEIADYYVKSQCITVFFKQFFLPSTWKNNNFSGSVWHWYFWFLHLVSKTKPIQCMTELSQCVISKKHSSGLWLFQSLEPLVRHRKIYSSRALGVLQV